MNTTDVVTVSVNPASRIADDPRWLALCARDARSDGQFVYSVSTTGVYCRPSCGARRARPEHVQFHDTAQEAERAGFRPCRRCRPHLAASWNEQQHIVTDLCRFIESASSEPSLDTLARRVGWSPYHLHRVFKAVTGVTPKAYAREHRARRLCHALTRDGTVTDAIFSAGYGSSGHFYAEASGILGMHPVVFRGGGAGEHIRFGIGQCGLGAVLVAHSGKGVCAIALGDDSEHLIDGLKAQFPHATLEPGDASFGAWMAVVIGWIDGVGPAAGSLPLDIRGTAFQRRVWEALQAIPLGTTLTYGELAARLGMPKASRAVARACATNVLAVAIPCHRVIRQDGALAGYRWGVDRKRDLLERERQRAAGLPGLSPVRLIVDE